MLDRRDLEKHRVRVVTCEQPTVIAGHAFTTGTIKRTSFEQVIPNTMVQYFKRADGAGCEIPSENAKAGGKPVQDQHVHEHGTCFNVKDRGLVVMSSCGHAGIVNTRATGDGGLRGEEAARRAGRVPPFPASEDYIRKTIGELKALDADVIIPMHCSGPTMVQLMRSELADRLLTSTTGTEFIFGT